MAVDTDYDLLVHGLNDLAKKIGSLRDEVERRRLQEVREHLDPNTMDWVDLIGLRLLSIRPIFEGLQAGSRKVLGSDPGDAVFDVEPLPAPDQAPET